MTILRVDYQLTGHKKLILAVGWSEDHIVTAEQGVLKIWSVRPGQQGGGPTLLHAIACSRQPLKALFMTPGGSFIVGVFEELGVVLFNITSPRKEEHVLLQLGESGRENKVLAAVWNRDICSLALATEQGGIRIYELLPARTGSGNSKDACQGHRDGNVTRTLPVTLMFRHDIVIKSTMSEGRVSMMTKRTTRSDLQKAMFGRVHCLSTEDMPRARGGGIATLVGVADGRHLCVWDMVSGVTLLTAHSIAPTGCKVQSVAWDGAAALVALLYAVNEAPKRVDVHQLDVAGQATTQLLSYTPDSPIAGVSFSAIAENAAQPIDGLNPRSPELSPPRQAFFHVVDRQRTLRSWVLHSRGAIAAVAYSLPAPAPRIPIPKDALALAMGKSPDEIHDDTDAGRRKILVEKNEETEKARRPGRKQRPFDASKGHEEAVDSRGLSSGASVAAVIPCSLPGKIGNSFVIVAGVSLTGVTFLHTHGILPAKGAVRQLHRGMLASASASAGVGAATAGDDSQEQNIFSMHVVTLEARSLQALAILWAERPSFQVLDVGDAGRATVMEDIPLSRMLRKGHPPKSSRTNDGSFVTCWSHSTALSTVLCGWSDGVVDVVDPRSHRHVQLVPRDGDDCNAVTALSVMPLSVLPHSRALFMSEWVDGECDVEGQGGESDAEARGMGTLALLGNADGTISAWPTSGACRPMHVLLAHAGEVVSIRTTLDAPPDERLRSPPAGNVNDMKHAAGYSVRGRQRKGAGSRICRLEPERERSTFFVVTAGAKREVKVWGVDVLADNNAPPLALGGYTIVGTRPDDHLTVVELLSERFMACGFASGAVETWAIPFDCRGKMMGTTRAAQQAFPNAHGAAVTSMSVSFCIEDATGRRGRDGGRTILTTSVDRTVVRWVSTVPGDSIRPLRRYCLSCEPAAAVLLPPPFPGTGTGLSSSSCSRGQVQSRRVPSGEESSTFRVLAAVSGDLVTLDFASAKQLLGDGSDAKYTVRALSNAFPGSPCIAMMPPVPSSRVEPLAPGRHGRRWRVGGIEGQDVGFYDVTGGTRGLVRNWEMAGAKRFVKAASVRNAWEFHTRCRQEQLNARPPGCERRDTGVIEKNAEPTRETHRGTKRRQCTTDMGYASAESRSISLTAKFAILRGIGVEGDRNDDEGILANTFKRMSGGRLVKLDPAFVPVYYSSKRRQGAVKDSKDSKDGKDLEFGTTEDPRKSCSVRLLDSKREAELSGGGYSLELTMPSRRTNKEAQGDNGTCFRARSVEHRCSPGTEASRPTYHADVVGSRAQSPVTPTDWGLQSKDFQSVGSAPIGWPPSLPPPTHADDSNAEDFLVELFQDSLGGEKADPGVMSSPTTWCDHEKGLGEEGTLARCPQQDREDRKPWSKRRRRTEGEPEARGASMAGRVTAAATAVARQKREAADSHRLALAPFVVERTTGEGHLSRPQFHSDSAQAPPSGMLGVGVAVPRGFSDARMRAASQRSIMPTPVAHAARQGTNGLQGAADAVALGANDEAASSTPPTQKSSRDEVFPAGLVLCKYFREASSGREILMLEVEKAAIRPDPLPLKWASHEGLKGAASEEFAGDSDTSVDGVASAESGETAEIEALSPRSRGLYEVFKSLAGGRELLAQEGLCKWGYVSRAVRRGLVSQYQVRCIFREAHGGRQRGKMVWRDMIVFYEGMEEALNKTCGPPLVDRFSEDSKDWDFLMVSIYLSKRGEVFVVALDAGSRPPPAPETVRGGSGPGVVAWATASVTNPDLPVHLKLSGLRSEHEYDLYAYAESGSGRKMAEIIEGRHGERLMVFSSEPALTGMSANSVKATRLTLRTAQEPGEELDLPWEALSEEDKMAETMAALSDPAVARIVRELGLDYPTSDDLARCGSDAVSRNKWRAFGRWWSVTDRGKAERSAFLLRECIFAAQQPEILEEAARMGVQLLEGDWTVAVPGSEAFHSEEMKKTSSGRQRRWAAFRSWYRGGKVFDRAHESQIRAALVHDLPSPGSVGRPLTPCFSSTDFVQPVAPATKRKASTLGDSKAAPMTPPTPNDSSLVSGRVEEGQLVEPSPSGGTAAATLSVGNAAEEVSGLATEATKDTAAVEEGHILDDPSSPESPPLSDPPAILRSSSGKPVAAGSSTTPSRGNGAAGHGLERASRSIAGKQTQNSKPDRSPSGDHEEDGRKGSLSPYSGGVPSEDVDFGEEAFDLKVRTPVGKRITIWDEKEEEVGVSSGGVRHGNDGSGASKLDTSGTPSLVSRSGSRSDAARKKRMEARRKFLAARTLEATEASSKVGRLLEMKKRDDRAKRAGLASSGVSAPQEAFGPREKRSRRKRRSQVEHELALKRADELLENCEKAQEIRRRQGSLGTLRPEDVAAIGVFDSFNLEDFEPEKPNLDLFVRHQTPKAKDEQRQRQHVVDEASDDVSSETAAWLPSSSEERALEAQLACVHPDVCLVAVSENVGVPDPEDACLALQHRTSRWEAFLGWYFRENATGDASAFTPQRRALVRSEAVAAMADDAVRAEMRQNELDPEECTVAHFLEWYCDDEIKSRVDFRRRRVEEVLQARRLLAMHALAFVPVPYLFLEPPRFVGPPSPASVPRFVVFRSRCPEAFSWAEISRWYGEAELNPDDEMMRAGERVGQLSAQLDASVMEEAENEALERRIARWEDLRAAFMRVSENELFEDPFTVGKGAWQFSAALSSWEELVYLGFEFGSGLENQDELLDALEAARQEVKDERDRFAAELRECEQAELRRLEEEKRRREEEERLRWMRETQERRCLVREHMANLKRQRALDAERAAMAREEALTLTFAQEERRLLEARRAVEAAAEEELRLRKVSSAAAAEAAAEARRRQDDEIAAMTSEDTRSRALRDARAAAEALRQDREVFLRELYAPFVPLRAEDYACRRESSTKEGNRGLNKRRGRRASRRWKGVADTPLIGGGGKVPLSNAPKATPGPRFVPHAQAVLDSIDPQPVTVGRLSREFLNLLGLPHEAVTDIYNQGNWTLHDDSAMVDGIQLGRVFSMFEKDDVRKNLVPVVPLERLGKRESREGGSTSLLQRSSHRLSPAAPSADLQRRLHPPQSFRDRFLVSRGIPEHHHLPLASSGSLPESGISGASPPGSSSPGDRTTRHDPVGDHVTSSECGTLSGSRVVHTGPESGMGIPFPGEERGEGAKWIKASMMNIDASTRTNKNLCGRPEQRRVGCDIWPPPMVKSTADDHRSAGSMSWPSSPPRLASVASRSSHIPVEAGHKQQQQHLQWGGFGPGHVPRFFRGRFGVAGKRKTLNGRKPSAGTGDLMKARHDKELGLGRVEGKSDPVHSTTLLPSSPAADGIVVEESGTSYIGLSSTVTSDGPTIDRGRPVAVP